jgi:hypothetical protein
MATTADNFKNLILVKVGEHVTGGPVSTVIDTLWTMYADKALIAPRLQYFYVLAEAFDVKIGSIADGAFTPVGIVQHKALDDKVSAWQKQKASALLDIAKIERGYNQVRTPVTGTLTTTAPISPADDTRTTGAFDANDRSLRGDAYLPGFSNGSRII